MRGGRLDGTVREIGVLEGNELRVQYGEQNRPEAHDDAQLSGGLGSALPSLRFAERSHDIIFEAKPPLGETLLRAPSQTDVQEPTSDGLGIRPALSADRFIPFRLVFWCFVCSGVWPQFSPGIDPCLESNEAASGFLSGARGG